MPIRSGMIAAVLFTLLAGATNVRADEPKESALRLPDGTIVFYTKNPTDAAPAIDGVLLSAREYQQLLEQIEQWKKAKAATKPLAPSICRIEYTLKPKVDRPAATVTITYQFKTTAPGSAILLGGQKAFAVKATMGSSPPVLESTPDGLVVLIDKPGEHALMITFEAPVTPQNKGELGFEIGLPRAAITTLAFVSHPDLKSLTLGTRLPDANGKMADLKSVSIDPKRYATDGVPLGPTDVLALGWDSPGSTPTPTENTLEIDAAIRVEERSVETAATLKLRGPNRDWTLSLPPGMTLASVLDTTKLTPPTDAKSNTWTVALPAGVTDATLTASMKQPRAETKAPANFAFGPIAAKGTVRTNGTLRLYAPFNVRIVPKANADLRRVDAPAVADDSPTAVFRFANLTNLDKKTAPLFEYELRAATGFVASQPQHTLTLTPLGWRLRSEFRIAPIRTALEQVTLELPAGWQDPTFAPLDLVDEVQGGGDAATTRLLTLRLATPQREPFELTLDARLPLNADVREASLPLPRLTSARERDATVTVTVPEPFEVKGTLHEWDAGKIAAVASDFSTAKATTLAGRFDGSVARVDVTWQPAKPRYAAEIVSDVVLSDRQAVVTQTLKLTFPEGTPRRVKFTGATNLVGFRSTPLLDATGPGEWTYTAPGSKDATVTLSFAVPWKVDAPVPFVWPDAATVQSTVRIHGTTTGRRAVGFDGPWRECAPEPQPERDTLPSLTLTGSGANLPLSLTWADADITGSVIIDRAVHQWWLTRDNPPQARSRFLLKRWPALLEVDVPSTGALSVLVDRQRVDPILLKNSDSEVKTFGIPLPDAKATRTSLLIEMRYSGAIGDELTPIALKGAVLRGVAWWQIVPPANTLPFAFGHLNPEIAWQTHDGLLQPTAGVTDASYDKWLSEPGELERSPGDAAMTASQTRPGPVRLYSIPRYTAFAVGTLLMALLGTLLLKLPARWLTPVIAVGLIGIAVLSLFQPQPMSQLAYAVQPGCVITAIVLGLTAAVKSWRRSRNSRSATFSRGTPPPMPFTATLDLSPMPSRTGSAATPPVPSAS